MYIIFIVHVHYSLYMYIFIVIAIITVQSVIKDFLLILTIEMELLSSHGILLPPNMHGLTDEQVTDLKLKDEYADTCVPCGGHVNNPDPVGRRNGRGKSFRLETISHFTVDVFIITNNNYCFLS